MADHGNTPAPTSGPTLEAIEHEAADTPSEDLHTLAAKATAKERAFAEALVGDAAGNTSRAAELAGYRGAPNKVGPRVAKRPHVRALVALLQREAIADFVEHTPAGQALAERQRARAAEADHHAELARETLEHLTAVGFADITELVEWDDAGPRFKDSKTVPEHARRAVQSVSRVVKPDGSVETKLTMHPKVPALAQLVKITGQAQPDKADVHVHGDAIVVMYPENGREAVLGEDGRG